MTAPARDHIGSIRIYVHLRAADVALMRQMRPSEIWYFVRHADLPPVHELPSWCVRVNVLSAVRRIFSTKARSIEIPEPLWARFLPTALVLMLAARIARVTTGSPRTTVFYALENNSPERALFGDSPVPRPARRAFVWFLGLVVSRLVDRVAFGSDGSALAYDQMKTLHISDKRVITALPARPMTPAGEHPAEERAVSVLFVGGLEYRKGVSLLMEAWPRVEAEGLPATVSIIGSGPLQRDVEAWAERRPMTRRYLGQIPYEQLAEHYDLADVLAAPSIRDGRWREQIGLQLRESLSHGLTVVSSDETGLADWLRQHGHRVVRLADLSTNLASELISAIDRPLPRSSVRESLPDVDGRVAADAWLHR